MADPIDREAVKEWLAKWDGYIDADIIARMQCRVVDIPSAQPELGKNSPSEQHKMDKLGVKTEETCTDSISRQAAIEVIDAVFPVDPMKSEYAQGIACGAALAKTYIEQLPSAQPERTCVNCGRTANNGGWYADGGTRCPIEEHYALPKDGYCYLWEKRNVTDDNYPERREE